MHFGLVMECDYREGRTQEEAFAEALSIADLAEESGLDGVWIAERHFAAPRRPLDPGGAGIPSIASVPLVLAAAIAARTRRVRIGTGVVVTSPRPRAISRRIARRGGRRATRATGTCISAFRSTSRRRRRRRARSPRRAPSWRIDVWARTWRRPSAAGTTGSEERAQRAERLSQVSYDELLGGRLAYGTPDMVVARLREWRDQLGLSGVIMEPNVGGRMPLERVLGSIRLYAREVAPRLRDGVVRGCARPLPPSARESRTP